MADIVDEFRKSARIERSGANLIRVAFTYGDSPGEEADRFRANKVTQDLISRVMAGHLTHSSNLAGETVQFFQDRVETVGQSWMKLSSSIKATPASDPRYELLTLTRDLKRREYESAAQKLGAAETLRDSERKGQGSRLELLDAASPPEQPETPRSVIWLIGLGSGLAAGLLAELWRALRRATPAFGVPNAAEPA